MNGDEWIRKHKKLLLSMKDLLYQRQMINDDLRKVRKDLVVLDDELVKGKIKR